MHKHLLVTLPFCNRILDLVVKHQHEPAISLHYLTKGLERPCQHITMQRNDSADVQSAVVASIKQPSKDVLLQNTWRNILSIFYSQSSNSSDVGTNVHGKLSASSERGVSTDKCKAAAPPQTLEAQPSALTLKSEIFNDCRYFKSLMKAHSLIRKQL